MHEMGVRQENISRDYYIASKFNMDLKTQRLLLVCKAKNERLF